MSNIENGYLFGKIPLRDLILSEIPNLLSLINLTKGIKET